MPNYYLVTRNPIARAGIIRTLMRKGYRLFGNCTVSDYFNKWPANKWPVVITRSDGEFAKKPIIDLMTYVSGANPLMHTRISPNHADSIPVCNPTTETIPMVLPQPAKYNITYERADGDVGNYTVSNPIEANKDSITVYTFGRGVRTFKKSQIRRFAKVA